MFKGIKDNVFANIMSVFTLCIALITTFVYARSIKGILGEMRSFPTQLLAVLYCVIIGFCVFNVIICYMHTLNTSKTRLKLYRQVGATKIQLLLSQIVEMFIKYNISYFVCTIISVFGISQADSEHFCSLAVVDYVIVYFVMLTVVLISTFIAATNILFPRHLR